MIECGPPEVCAEDTRQEHLLVLEKRNHKDENVHSIQYVLRRDISLVRATIVLVILMNIPYGRYVLYPFTLFSTWIHEMCHGLMAIMVGGGIRELHIYKDGSGLAFTYTSGAAWKRAFVASAGYMGTAFVGGILLLFRRTLHGPTIGVISTGVAILLSCALFVRNWFGIGVLSLIGVVLILLGWRLKALWVGELYAFLCIVTSFNALTNIRDLFASGQGYVGGELMWSDAHTVAEYWKLPYWFWAACWLGFAIVMTLIGLVFPLKGPKSSDRGTVVTPSAPNEHDVVIEAECVNATEEDMVKEAMKRSLYDA